MFVFAGPFQGPALTIAFEGASLTTEEVCTLQTIPPSKIRGQPCQYGIGLLGAYHVTELLLIVSSGCLYLFDPPGQVLVASLADGRAVTSGGIPVGKAYALKGTVPSMMYWYSSMDVNLAVFVILWKRIILRRMGCIACQGAFLLFISHNVLKFS